ncbi:hypothetical protein Pint_03804 [Pistacia integerrima]|uniref:Uncharacterized protein n=1 Tax=Pistacia integerrima TaxID=434235 RepID=A0ACC0Z310_9ROSI|nr:hypothetical protein Pint_03804 [Pistacia integerrima]
MSMGRRRGRSPSNGSPSRLDPSSSLQAVVLSVLLAGSVGIFQWSISFQEAEFMNKRLVKCRVQFVQERKPYLDIHIRLGIEEIEL